MPYGTAVADTDGDGRQEIIVSRWWLVNSKYREGDFRIMAYEFKLADEDKDEVDDDVDICHDTMIPEMTVPQSGVLGNNRYALIDDDLVFDTVVPADRVPDRTFTLADTQGCSCEQILTSMGIMQGGQWKFGCSKSVMETWVRE
ncbi:MAG: hypothetical protein KKF44_08905 [Nanoarchaeota archaeon]|nr:hypothetical protein [Nanoarchaeota archaeon]